MKRISCLSNSIVALALVMATQTAQAAIDSYGQVLTLTPNADETQMLLYWYPIQDDFSPAAPCNVRPYTLSLYNDSALVATFNQNNSPLSGNTGKCFLQKTITSGVSFSDKVSPGGWFASAQRVNWPKISESRTIYACTSKQGKQPMYRAHHLTYTDNFYTTSISDRNIALSIGYIDGGVPFSMPMQARFNSRPFYRLFKGAPQLVHFYTASDWERNWTMQQGYEYEGIEGFVFNTQKPGTLPLHIFTYYNGSTGDLQHYYTLSLNDPETAGFDYEGIAGYACAP